MVDHNIIPWDLWHRRLGHLHFRALSGLQRMVKSMHSFDFVHDTVYRGCDLGNNVKNKFPSNHTRSKGILYLFHSDLCGPISSPSLIGISTLFYALMISPVRPRFTSWKRKVKPSVNSKSIKLYLRITQIGISIP